LKKNRAADGLMKAMKYDTRYPMQREREPKDDEQGFMLLGLIVAIAIILLLLGTAASEAAFSIRRDRELESARRANQYVRAIRKFYIKNGHYPGSIEQLVQTNNVRYLRQKYVDPLTGKADFRLIAVGQNKTTVKGFFGEPLGGISSAGLGSAAGMQSGGGIAGPGGAAGASGGFGSPGVTNTSGTSGPGGAAGTSGPNGASGGSGSGGGTGPGGSTQAGGLGGFPGSGGLGGASLGPIMGVGSSSTGNSILIVNEQTTYQTWEFLYDPRVEQLKAAAALNAGAGSTGASSLGTQPNGGFGQTSSFGPANGSTPTNATGATGNSGASGSSTPGGNGTPSGTTPP
jgi:type II secretory pathway pseudopilin PulG